MSYTDRAGNVHSYTYDVLGGQTTDAITTLATGFDSSVLRIQTAYNALGDPYLVTTYNAASGGSIVNQVEDLYNGLDQLTQEYQSHSGAVVIGTTPSVQYAYTEMSSGLNNSRLTSMTYPNGRVLTYTYNAGIDNAISRLSSISDSSATLESEVYLGLGTVVERDHPQPNVNQSFISQNGGTGDAGDKYTGLDRFGRVAEVNWVNASTHTSTDDFQYGYDQDANAQYQNNMVDSAFSALFHQSGTGNGYDGLNQQTGFARGALSASQQGGQLDTVASPSTTESWNMAALGNFASVTLNGTQTNETTNQQNELTAVGASSLTFDKNGNMLTDAQGHSYSYNAWNELLSVKNGGTTLDAYTVDGLGRRVTENAGTLADIYFSSQGQVLEEDVSGSMQDQYVWSPVYVNAMIERDTPTQRLYVLQDANWNVTALVNIAGQVVERYVYDSYGAVTYLTASWGSEAQSAYGWHYLFQGGRLDSATGLYHFDHRDYSPTLQRWVQADPSGFSAGGTNLYATEGDNPTNETDPSGLKGIIGRAANLPPPAVTVQQLDAGRSDVHYWQDAPTESKTEAFFNSLGNGLDNVGKGGWAVLHDIGTIPVDLVGTAVSSSYRPISYYGRGSLQAQQRGTPWYQVSTEFGANAGTLGVYGMGKGAYQWYETGDPSAYQQASSGFLLGTVGAWALQGLGSGQGKGSGLTSADSWGRAGTLADHFARHGGDFGATSPENYAQMASEFLQESQARGLPTKVDANGIIRVYDPETNSFGAYNADGTTATFFKPTRGQAYWNDQPGTAPWGP